MVCTAEGGSEAEEMVLDTGSVGLGAGMTGGKYPRVMGSGGK